MSLPRLIFFVMRVLLVEDDDMIGDSVRKGLRHDGFAIDWVRDGEAAVQAVITPGAPSAAGADPGTSMFDLMLLDLGLPKRDGLEVVREVRQRGIAIPILILTARDGLLDKVNGLNAGADDYLLKPFEMLELVARVQALLRRRADPTEPVARPDILVGGLRMSRVERRIFVEAAPLELSPREFAVLELLMLRQGRVVSKVQLQDHLASFGRAIGEASHDVVGDTAIEVYVHRVRRKIEHSDAEIVTVRGFGYLLQARGTAA
jgi:DNA-binding response OmpR family regulator